MFPYSQTVHYDRDNRENEMKCSFVHVCRSRNELLILCGYIGALLAISRQYISIVPALYEYTR